MKVVVRNVTTAGLWAQAMVERPNWHAWSEEFGIAEALSGSA
jgi:hypothetical protein